MPFIAHALFYFSYATVALATGLALARIGGGSASESTLAGLSVFAAFAITHAALTAAHATGAVRATEKRLKGEIEKIRTLHKETITDVAAVADRLDRLDVAVAEVAHARAEAAPSEVRAIEALVDRLGRSFDARFEEMKRVAGPAAPIGAPSMTGRSPIDVVREALNENRIELHLQPIVALPQRRTAFYEGYTRLKDASGRVILPGEFMPAAEQAGMMTAIDNVLLFRCVQIVRKLAKQDRRIGIFCNLSPRSLGDEHFFPQFLDFMMENRDLAGAVVFELPQDAYESRTGVQARAMARLADLGFRFSIDHVTHLDVDLQDLDRAGVRFVKATGRTLIDQLIHGGVRPRSNIARELSAADVVTVMRRYGVDLIAERIEDEAMVREILDLDPPFAQGHLFGAARPIKESLMEETAPPPGFATRGRGGLSA